MIQSENGQPVTDQQVAEIGKAMAINSLADPDNNPDAMWKERPYLDGASKNTSVRVIQNGLVTRNGRLQEDHRTAVDRPRPG